jgi:TetR/AcrR family transcriptional repressor of lmrAB and yxaGH operons
MTTVIVGLYPGVHMGTRKPSVQPSRLAAEPPRNRMVRSAATLIRERGFHGVGMRQVVAHSKGPRGSLQRFFPGGKTQLASEALSLANSEYVADVENRLAAASDLAGAIAATVAPWRELLLDNDYALGCPFAATLVDSAANDALRDQIADSFEAWHSSLTDVLIKHGHPAATAADQAMVLIAALEGALILARAARSTEPLDAVQRAFSRQ